MGPQRFDSHLFPVPQWRVLETQKERQVWGQKIYYSCVISSVHTSPVLMLLFVLKRCLPCLRLEDIPECYMNCMALSFKVLLFDVFGSLFPYAHRKCCVVVNGDCG